MIEIAIDGPAASGKTTLGLELARRFRCLFVETGKMYRAVALGLERGLELVDIRIDMTDEGRTLLNGEDVSELLHTPSLDQGSSRVATQPEVRERLVALQRDIAAAHDVVMEGRDIGTVVLPNADVKLFLQASPRERALRRARQRHETDVEKNLTEIQARDERDRTRAVSPLNPARDAITIETDNKSLAQVIRETVDLVERRLGGR
jgi:CMP/dCMP kinase